MKRLSNVLMMAVLIISTCLMSCGETIIIGSTDSPAQKPEPTPTPTPTPQDPDPEPEPDPEPVPVNFTTAADQLKIAKQDGAAIAIWFKYKGDLYHAVFVNEGGNYVLQAETAGTRNELELGIGKHIPDGTNLLLYGQEEDDDYTFEITDEHNPSEPELLAGFYGMGKITMETKELNTTVTGAATFKDLSICTSSLSMYDELFAYEDQKSGASVPRDDEEEKMLENDITSNYNNGSLDGAMIVTTTGYADATTFHFRTISEINQIINASTDGSTDNTQRADASLLMTSVANEMTKTNQAVEEYVYQGGGTEPDPEDEPEPEPASRAVVRRRRYRYRAYL